MRIAVSLNLTPFPIYKYKKEIAVKNYLKEKLELEYSRAIKKGFGRGTYGFYISAAKAIDSGKRDLALKILDAMKEKEYKIGQNQFNFEGEIECKNCALFSEAEDTEFLIRVYLFNKENKIKKLYFNYDKYGRFIPRGALLDIETIKKICETRFVAVA